jgi:hypothetical protein
MLPPEDGDISVNGWRPRHSKGMDGNSSIVCFMRRAEPQLHIAAM